MSRFTASVSAFARQQRVREFLLWCLPALLIGLVLRVVLTVQMPYGFFHDDTGDFLSTPDKLLSEFEWNLHSKKTFLTPILFTLPFLVRVPALIAIPIGQHLLGLVMIVQIGLLCRLWFTHWRWFILPLTILAAINPFYLWYEHTLMAETAFVVCTLMVVIAGTLYYAKPDRKRFIFLCVALFLEAGARPEGKLLFLFGLLLVAMVHWRNWRRDWRQFAILFGLAVATHFMTKTSQAGLLLYTSVARMTPDQMWVAPGFIDYIRPVRDDLQARWLKRPSFPRVSDRREVAKAVRNYLRAKPEAVKFGSHTDVNAYCLRLAMETCLRNLSALPGHVIAKFRSVSNEAPIGTFDSHWLFDKQREAFLDQQPRLARMEPRVTGHKLRTVEDINRFVDEHYCELPWFNQLHDRWLLVTNGWRMQDDQYPHEGWPGQFHHHPGIPYYFILGGIGLITMAWRFRDPLRPFHAAWALTLLAFFFVIMLTANVRPRFRFVFEPFWFLYIAGILDTLLFAAGALFRRR
ncbi:MAG: hypothetical protein ABI680_15475 [Chthoniobacteraceae bacterium]